MNNSSGAETGAGGPRSHGPATRPSREQAVAHGVTTGTSASDDSPLITSDESPSPSPHALPKPAPVLSLVVPAYNEAARIGATLPEARLFLDQLGVSYEFIVSNDGSRDETVDLVSRFIGDWPRARLVGYAVNRGKGSALRTGVLATTGTRVIFMDADLSTPLDEIPRALALLDSGADVVIGSRSAQGARVSQKQPRYRRWGAKLFNQLRDQLLGLGDLGDTQCGFKAFRGDVARQLFAAQRIQRWMFDAEILYIARRKRLRIIAMPVRWSDARGSKLRLFRDTAHMFRDLVRIRIWHRGV